MSSNLRMISAKIAIRPWPAMDIASLEFDRFARNQYRKIEEARQAHIGGSRQCRGTSNTQTSAERQQLPLSARWDRRGSSRRRSQRRRVSSSSLRREIEARTGWGQRAARDKTSSAGGNRCYLGQEYRIEKETRRGYDLLAIYSWAHTRQDGHDLLGVHSIQLRHWG
jgi:hypothetical protein